MKSEDDLCVRCNYLRGHKSCDKCKKMQDDTDEIAAFIYVLLRDYLSSTNIQSAIKNSKLELAALQGDCGFHNKNEKIQQQAISLRNQFNE